MFKIALAAACLTCANCGRQVVDMAPRSQSVVRESSQSILQDIAKSARSPLRSISMLLLSATSKAAFHPSLHGTLASRCRGDMVIRGLAGQQLFVKPYSRLRPVVLAGEAAPSLPLWLDLRGSPCAKDMDALLSLYGGVKKAFEDAGKSPPNGTAVAGIIHNSEDLDGNEGKSELPVLVFREGGDLWSGENRVGQSMVAINQDGREQEEAVGASICKRDEYLALFGAINSVVPLINFILYMTLLWDTWGDLWEDEKKDISTKIITEIQDSKGLAGVSKVARDYYKDVSIALLLKPDQSMWFDALSDSSSDAADAPTGTREELSEQQQTLGETIYYANAVLVRNCRQFESYIDEAHQWEDQTDVERYHILSKRHWENKLDGINSVLHAE